jgi:hypothetical protein
MDRLAEYMHEFALLLGLETFPTFKGIKKASTGLKAAVPPAYRQRAWKNVQQARQVPASKPARALQSIERMLGEDKISNAELIDSSERVVYRFHVEGDEQEFVHSSIKQEGFVDGTITGLVGADDTMHLYIRDFAKRDIRLLVRDEDVARQLLSHFRQGVLRFKVAGSWQRTESGWVPETSKCLIETYEVLDETPLTEIFDSLARVEGNGWNELEDPQGMWKELRGVH